jgi:hypothetical protein
MAIIRAERSSIAAVRFSWIITRFSFSNVASEPESSLSRFGQTGFRRKRDIPDAADQE